MTAIQAGTTAVTLAHLAAIVCGVPLLDARIISAAHSS
jgi:hypothetical protein